MQTAQSVLEDLQASLAAVAVDAPLPQNEERLLFYALNGALHVEIYADPLGDHLPAVLEALARPQVAERLVYLSLRGPDEGANGTRNWDLSPLLAGCFPQLAGLFIEPSPPEFHNRSIVAVDYDEEGLLGQLLDRMPALRSLTAPSAPDSRFFRREVHPLQELRIEAGYDTQGFVRNLAATDCFPGLRALDYTDYCETYAGDVPEKATPYGHFQELFGSPGFAPVKLFTLRNPILTEEELRELKRLRPQLLFQVVWTSSEFIR